MAYLPPPPAPVIVHVEQANRTPTETTASVGRVIRATSEAVLTSKAAPRFVDDQLRFGRKATAKKRNKAWACGRA